MAILCGYSFKTFYLQLFIIGAQNFIKKPVDWNYFFFKGYSSVESDLWKNMSLLACRNRSPWDNQPFSEIPILQLKKIACWILSQHLPTSKGFEMLWCVVQDCPCEFTSERIIAPRGIMNIVSATGQVCVFGITSLLSNGMHCVGGVVVLPNPASSIFIQRWNSKCRKQNWQEGGVW